MQWTIWCGGLIGQLGAGQLGAGQLGVMDNWVPLLEHILLNFVYENLVLYAFHIKGCVIQRQKLRFQYQYHQILFVSF